MPGTKRMRATHPAVRVPESDTVVSRIILSETAHPIQPLRRVKRLWQPASAHTLSGRRPGCVARVPFVRRARPRGKGRAVASMPRIENGSRFCRDIPVRPSVRSPGRKRRPAGGRRFASRAIPPHLPITSSGRRQPVGWGIACCRSCRVAAEARLTKKTTRAVSGLRPNANT